MGQRTVRELLHSRPIGIALLAAVYLVAARFGLAFGVVEQVTAIWPASGLALAALFLGGAALWPGVWLGACAANLLAEAPPWTVLGIATGNTLEALLGLWILRRASFDATLERLRDVLALLLVAACSTLPAALVGVASLCLGDVQPWSSFARLAGTWWWGDAMGIVLLAMPLFACSAGARVSWRPLRALEFTALLLGLVWTSFAVFGERPEGAPDSLRYAAYPFVIWAAIRFGQRGVSVAVLVASVVTAWATVRGLGPFGAADLESRWLPLQAFTAILAITGALLGAAIGERDRAGRQRLAEFAVARILAQAGDLAEATRRVVESICATLDFEVGALWTVDARARVLRCVEIWQREGFEAEEFVALSRRMTFAPGVGLPGRAWSSGAPAWSENVAGVASFPRAAAAAADGLRAAFCFPVLVEGEVLGVLEFYSRRARGLDFGLQNSLASVGSHFGHFLRRKSAEDAVRASEVRKAGVLASVMDAIVTIDHEGRLMEFNPGAERMFGIEAAGALGRDLAELIVPQRHRDGHRRGLARVVESGRTEIVNRSLYMSALRSDGSEFPVELTITRVAGAHPPLFTGFVRDITERRRAEAERSQLLELERHARAEAEALAAHLRREQEAKDGFLALLGHELRNPLAPISNALHILRSSAAGSPDAPRLYRIMERQVRHMARLVDDLLDVSRIARGTIEMRFEPIDLVTVVEGVVEASSPFLDERRHRLLLQLPSCAVHVTGDETRLHQAISNVLNNAARYTPDGGEIEVSLAPGEEEAVLRVRDNGIGIRGEDLQRIFEAFTQADRIPGRLHEGLGIGLTLARQLVELHGGTIRAHSSGPHSGSEFEVRLPLARQARDSAPDPARGVLVPAQRRRVLVVDDNRDSADTLVTLLRAAGHETEVAYDGREALASFRARLPEVVLLDIELPDGLDGHQVAKLMREFARDARVRLVAVTGYGRAEDRVDSQAAGFDLHVVKPLDPDDLERIVGA